MENRYSSPSTKLKEKSLIFYLLLANLVAALIVPKIFTQGMFIDGMTYATIARNLSLGLGSFWKPLYTEAVYNPFYEHPPLVFAIQSIFFRIFGDSFLVEKFYSFTTLMLTIYILFKTWTLLNLKENKKNYLHWFPAMLFIIIPVVSWSYRNNMLENTTSIFTLLSIYFILKALFFKKNWLIYFPIAGVFIVFAFLSKGLVGLFPLTASIFYYIIFKNISISDLIKYLMLISLPVIIFLLIVIQIEDANFFLKKYFFDQIYKSLSGQREVTLSKFGRFYILYRIVMEILPMLVICFALYIYKIKKNYQILNYKNKTAFFIFIIALSASVPITLSLKQSNFYLILSMPFFSLSLALFFLPIIESFFNTLKINEKNILRINFSQIVILVCIFVLSALQYNKIGRGKDLFDDSKLISSKLKKHEVIGICGKINPYWGPVAYLSRFYQISISENTNKDKLISTKNCKIDNNKYIKIPLVTKKYDLYQKRIPYTRKHRF